MHIASVGSSIPARVTTQATEVNAGHDGDGDDGAGKAPAAAAAPAPTVNSSGQTVGQVLNVKA